ncbi:hypothetical protein PGTUg99_022214 [Puccinia graminis f. sp. tritici]|uniref:Secreted protein n=1 Tax=Puccinia graminis f. sp. tritici TaxID=56615 RepID=A0A5B0MSK8_PUCGR|nr:hypothetical protein PGTUg99_022214 [Puccinia graminis f. sp. tritici]
MQSHTLTSCVALICALMIPCPLVAAHVIGFEARICPQCHPVSHVETSQPYKQTIMRCWKNAQCTSRIPVSIFYCNQCYTAVFVPQRRCANRHNLYERCVTKPRDEQTGIQLPQELPNEDEE